MLTHGALDPAERLVRRLRWFEGLAREVAGLPGGAPRGLTLVLFQSRSDYLEWVPLEESAGAHARRSAGSLAAVDGSGPWRFTVRTALHEYVHYLLASHGGLPAWYEEGLAEYLAGLRIREGWIELGVEDTLRTNLLRGRAAMPLAVLVGADTTSPEYHDSSLRGRFHDTAWSLFHHLRLGRPLGRQVLSRYLALVRAGEPSAPALEEALGFPLAVLEQELARYVASPPLPLERLELGRFRTKRPPLETRRLEAAEVSALLHELATLHPPPGPF